MVVGQAQLAILGQAIDTENKGYRFYVDAAEKASDAKAKEVLLSLANDEKYHAQVLEEQRQRIMASGNWAVDSAEKAAEYSKSRPQPSIIPTDRKKAVAIARASTDELEALKVGMETEQASYQFYLNAAGQVDVQAVKDLYLGLAQWENAHYLALQEMHDFLADPQGWYLKEERPILEG